MLEINKIHNTECLKGMMAIPDDCIDLIVTDPPYYIENLKEDLKDSTLRRSRNNIFCADWDSSFENLDQYKRFMSSVLDQFKRILKPKGQVYMFFSYHHIHWIRFMVENKDFRFYKYLVWYKPDTMGVFPNQYGCNYELVLWFRNDKEGGRVTLNIGCGQRDVWKINSALINYRKECGFHPTPKPIQMVRSLVKNGSNEGDLILDPFMGSGTTAVACKQTNRNYIGFELDQSYIDISNNRLNQEILSDLNSFTENNETT